MGPLDGRSADFCAGLAADALASRQRMGPWIASAVLALDALVFGGLSLTLPTTELPDAPCVRDLREEEGAVLVWPGDGSYWEGDIGRISVFQLLHERPSTNPGITSWSLEGGRARDALKKKGGFRYISYKNTHMGEAMGTPQRGWLLENGYRWVIIDVERDPTQVQWGARHFGPPVAECGTAIVHRIEPPEQR